MAENPATWNDDVKAIAAVFREDAEDAKNRICGHSIMVRIEQQVVVPLRTRISGLEAELKTLKDGGEMAAEIARADHKMIEELKGDLEEAEQLRERLAKILTDTANAFHDGPLNDGLWSWHDLAGLATTHRIAARASFHALRSYQHGNSATDLAQEAADFLEALLNAPDERRREIAAWCEKARKEKT